MNKDNILEIIADHQRAIDKLESELAQARAAGLDIAELERAVRSELSYLRDNQYRYKMQAKAWGLF